MEKKLNPTQRNALSDLASLLADPSLNIMPMEITSKDIQEVYNLSKKDAGLVIAILGLVADKAGLLTDVKPRTKRKWCGKIVNNPPGSKQLWEEAHGVYHRPKGHSPTGRNTSGRRRAVKR